MAIEASVEGTVKKIVTRIVRKPDLVFTQRLLLRILRLILWT